MTSSISRGLGAIVAQLEALNGPDVLAAFQRIIEFGDERCGVSPYG